jgi:hypothetical protein
MTPMIGNNLLLTLLHNLVMLEYRYVVIRGHALSNNNRDLMFRQGDGFEFN